jgi:hypothetical protein
MVNGHFSALTFRFSLKMNATLARSVIALPAGRPIFQWAPASRQADTKLFTIRIVCLGSIPEAHMMPSGPEAFDQGIYHLQASLDTAKKLATNRTIQRLFL